MVVDLMAEVLMMEEDLIKEGNSVLEEHRDSKKAASRYWDFYIKSQLGQNSLYIFLTIFPAKFSETKNNGVKIALLLAIYLAVFAVCFET